MLVSGQWRLTVGLSLMLHGLKGLSRASLFRAYRGNNASSVKNKTRWFMYSTKTLLDAWLEFWFAAKMSHSVNAGQTLHHMA